MNLAFGGIAKSGKSTATEYLVNNKNFTELAFAKPLKDIIKILFCIDDKYLYDQEFKEQIIPELNVSARQLLQVIGTELFRNDLHKYLPNLTLTGNNIWIHNMYKNIEKLKAENKNIIVSDKRFNNEYEYLKEWGFDVYDIEREAVKVKNDNVKHESEKGAPCDATIKNNNSLNELYTELDLIISGNKQIKGERSDDK